MSDAPQSHPAGQGAGMAISRRQFLAAAASLGAAACAAPAAAGSGLAVPRGLPGSIHAGHQHDHSKATLTLLSALGVHHLCSSLPAAEFGEAWSVEGLTRLRRHVESFGIHLECVPLPPVRDVARDPVIEETCRMIRNAGSAGIPMVKYSLSIAGPVRTGDETQWARIEHFLARIVPVAEKAKVRIALHPQETGMHPNGGLSGSVLGSVEGLQRYVGTCASEYHGLGFPHDTIAAMLRHPGDELAGVIRWFGLRRKIFTVHCGSVGTNHPNLPGSSGWNLMAALPLYREVGYQGMVIPDHVPAIEGDLDHYKAYAFCFGYIQALLQTLDAPVPASFRLQG